MKTHRVGMLVAVSGCILLSTTLWADPPEELAPSALGQINALLEEKASWTISQRKMDSELVHASKLARGEPFAPGAGNLQLDVEIQADGRVLVDMHANVTAALLALIEQSGGQVINHFAQFQAIRALVPVNQLETIAASEDLITLRRADQGMGNTGSVNSQGDTTHRGIAARATFGVTGAGVRVGVLSDSVDYYANSIASGDLAGLTILAGQSGMPGPGEGTAMLEIVQDLAPNAVLYFGTATGGQANFAQNILNLYSNGCDIIVDDWLYFAESPFQDGVVARAVNTVTTNGALFFSSAANSGNLDAGTSGTWEGDFVDGGPTVNPPISEVGRLHSFGATTYNTVNAGGSSRRVDLFWSDPLGASTNDYDLFVLDSTGSTVLRSSVAFQTGTQDPYEQTGTLNVGERIVIVKYTGVSRFIHLSTGRGRLAIPTSGTTYGHSAATNAFSVAAVDQATAFPGAFTGGAANPVETFSSDGLRRVFYQQNGTPITPGNFSSTGGTVRQKPDIAAADGVSTTVPGFSPFFGTSAAAPHAAGIAALILSYGAFTPDQVRNILTNTALDVNPAGVDRDSGWGLVMAYQAMQAATNSDYCINATRITGFSYTHTQSTISAGSAGDPSPTCIFNFGKGVWFRYTAPATGTLVVDTIGSTFDTALAIYTGGCGAFTQVACDDDAGGNLRSKITLAVTAGTTYYFLAGGYNQRSGTLVLNLNYVLNAAGMTINASDTGWYDETGHHVPGLENYFCGEDVVNVYRDFFVFPLPVFAGVITSANLIINTYTNETPDVSETFVLSDVTTPIATLVAGGSGLTGIYTDLGGGVAYGSRNFTAAESGISVSIPLNANFLTALANASGGQIALGGVVTTLNSATMGNEYLFGYSQGLPGDVKLQLSFAGSTSLNAADRGWYDDTGLHDPGNRNYAAGEYVGSQYRDWFVFNVPNFSGSIVQAELLINCYSNNSPSGLERFLLRHVSTPIATLVAGGSGLINIYNDLADGTVYSTRDVLVSESARRAIIPLNAAFINAATAARGGQIALGGSVATLAGAPIGDENLFLFSNAALADDATLRLTYGTSATINATTRGWYDHTGNHNAANLNYTVGEENLNPIGFRNFFLFKLPVLDQPVINAQLLLNGYVNTSPSGVETYEIRDVSTPIATLTNNASGQTAVYADLGSGVVFGSRDVYTNENFLPVAVPLNSTFNRGVMSLSGANTAFGGSIATLDATPSNEYLFGYSGTAPSDVQLWLGMAGDWPAAPYFIQTPVKVAGNSYQLVFAGTAGYAYELEASSDFQNWDVVTQIFMVSSTASYTYTDPLSRYRFFRVRLLP